MTMATTELLGSILAGDEVRWPGEGGPSENEFLEAAALHRVTPLIACELDKRSCGCPPTLQDAIQREAAKAVALSVFREHELIAILDRLADKGIEPVLIKGSGLAYAHYAQPHLRPSFDVDLLVAEKSIDELCVVFEERGYHRSHLVDGDLVTTQFDYERQDDRGVWHIYDVHRKIAIPQAFAHLLSYEQIAAEARAVQRLGPHARRPSDVHELVIALVHRVAHHSGDMRLFWLYDIHLLAGQLGEAEFDRFAEIAMATGISGVCASGLAEARRWFHTLLPDEKIDRLEAHSIAVKEESRSFVDGKSKLGVLMSDLRLIDGWQDRARLIHQHLFPSPAYMFRAYDARSRALLPMLYTHRFFTGAWKWLRK